jgi:hypothetical protein
MKIAILEDNNRIVEIKSGANMITLEKELAESVAKRIIEKSTMKQRLSADTMQKLISDGILEYFKELKELTKFMVG